MSDQEEIDDSSAPLIEHLAELRQRARNRRLAHVKPPRSLRHAPSLNQGLQYDEQIEVVPIGTNFLNGTHNASGFPL